MRTMMNISIIAALLGAMAISMGCEESPLTAGSGDTITVVANPGTAVLPPGPPADPANPLTKEILIDATVLSAGGVPKVGVAVFFSSNGEMRPSSCPAGVPAPPCTGVTTDSSGRAHDSVLVTQNDLAEVVVTAQSASIVGTVTIPHQTTLVPPVDHPPVATIVASPQAEQAKNGSVVFDGTGSNDQDLGDFITMYKWVITSTNPDADKTNPVVAEGPGVSGVSFPSDLFSIPFQNLQELTVTLLVTDDVDAPSVYAAFVADPTNPPVAYRAQQTIPYRIVAVRCSDNAEPTAVIAGAATQQIFGLPGQTVNFLADGTLSSDPETPLQSYTWNCGNGSIPIPQGNGSKVVCKYLVDQTPRTYPVTLVVTDQGTGAIVGGQYECSAASLPASIQVVVSPLAGGGP